MTCETRSSNIIDLGQRIGFYRRKKRLTQRELEDMAGLPKKVLSFYEIGRRKVPSEYLVPIADVLGISVDELVGREYDENDSATRTTVGQRIRWLREYVGLSVNDFAVSLGVSNSTIYRLEELEHSLSRNAVKTICRVYGVNEEWLQYQRGEMFADDALIKEEKERHNINCTPCQGHIEIV